MFLKTRKCFMSYVFCLLLVSSVVSGCGGGGDSITPSSSPPNTSGSSSGIVVDPYIVGAVIQEVASSGAILQESAPSGENGRFLFPRALTLGSIIRIKGTARGMHNNLPFVGTLKREVDSGGVMVVSPLTTLVGNGFSDAGALTLLNDAGLSGLSIADLYADPMAGLNGLLAISDADLVNLQAAIAVNQFMMMLGDYEMSNLEILQHREMLTQMARLIQQVLNRQVLEEALEDISGPMADAQVTPTMGAAIRAGVNIIDTSVARHMADPSKDPLEEATDMQSYMDDLALLYSIQENRGMAGVEAQIAQGNLPGIDAHSSPDINALIDSQAGNHGTIIAEAGPDQNVPVGTEVFLSGSFIAEDADEVTYFWAFESKPAGSLSHLPDNRSAFPSFTADREGAYVLSLTVYVDEEASIPDTVTIFSSGSDNLPPAANSGPDQHVTTGDTVALDGSASIDNDGDVLTYSWFLEAKPIGSGATLSDSAGPSPIFTADVDGTYIISLTVNDGLVDSVPDTVNVTAASGNVPPVAHAGPDQNVPVGTTVSLNGASSSDVDNDSLTYSWSLTVKPGSSSAALSNSSAVNPSFVADLPGTYQARLIVNDGTVNSFSDTVIVTAATGNVPPVANGGVNQNVASGSTVTLDGSGSSDADNDLLTYNWAFTAKPVGSTATLSSTLAAKPSFVADLAGTYTIRLIVNDGSANSAPDSVSITAANNNVRPTANGGPDQNVFVFDLVSLDGSASSDPDNDPLSYSWSITSKPGSSSATLSATNVADPTFVADYAGTYTIRLVVNDGSVTSTADSVMVTASSSNVAPIAHAGADQNVTAGDSVSLSGSGSSDSDSDPLTYSWSFTSKPSGSAAALSSSSAIAPGFAADVAGSYVIRLVVNDGTVNSAPDTVTVTAVAPPTNCTACHGQPPAVGAHTIHTGLASVNNDCATCHSNNNHMNGTKDVNMALTYSAKSGSPAWNGTSCSLVSCHGGKTTPNFLTGSINVNSQCTSCHASGTSQYNSYNSGKHTFHLDFLTCTSCHNTSTLAQNHFTKLNTTTMEGPASATIGGGSTSISSYSNRSCTISCHGTNKRW